jgi:CO/xanthine dehydrogenase Mo-binding subunit
MDTPCFVEDIYPRQMLYALTIRSPVAKGRLVSIEYPKLPNIYMLISAKDIPGKNRLEDSELPILASETLSYIGEPVALLLGPDKNMLEKYAEKCQVVVEEEPPVFASRPVAENMVLARREIRIGEPEAAFERAASIVRDDYSTGIQDHWYSEPIGAIAWLEHPHTETEDAEKTGKNPTRIVVRTATQWPFHVRRSVSRVLNIDTAGISVDPTLINLHMDGKIWYPSLVACHAALGAWITKKPVRLMLSRGEDFRYSPKRAGTDIGIASALDEKGAIIGTEISISVNLGAYGVNAAELLDHTCLGSLGVYKFDNLKLSGAALKTNIPPQGPFSGFGLSQGFFAIERHVSHIANLQKQNPAEWRKNNFSVTGILPLGPAVKDAAPGELLLDTVASMSGYDRKWASYELLRQSRRQRLSQGAAHDSMRDSWAEKGETLRGIGIALAYQGNGLLYTGTNQGNYSMELTLEKDGSLEIKTSIVYTGDSFCRLWAGIASEILSIDADKVRITNTTASPDCGISSASRNITVLTKVLEQTCLAIRKQRFRDPLPITVRKTIRPPKNPAWEERLPPPEGLLLDAGGFLRPGWASAVVEVEIDAIEYIPRVRGIWMSIDGGKILSEEQARRSLKAATTEALGWACREQISYVDGILPQKQFEDYSIFSPGDIPPIFIDFIWNTSEEPKGIGDLPFSCIPAAYLQAVSQAMDHHFKTIPLKPPDIWEAGKLKKVENSLS